MSRHVNLVCRDCVLDSKKSDATTNKYQKYRSVGSSFWDQGREHLKKVPII